MPDEDTTLDELTRYNPNLGRLFQREVGQPAPQEARDSSEHVLAVESEMARGKKLANDIVQQGIELRKEYADKIFGLVLGWIAFLCFLTFADAMFSFTAVIGKAIPAGTSITDLWLSDKLLMVLWGTATTSVLGLFVYVAKYLFPSNQKGTEDKSNQGDADDKD